MSSASARLTARLLVPTLAAAGAVALSGGTATAAASFSTAADAPPSGPAAAEIDRVIAEGRTLGRQLDLTAKPSPGLLARVALRCADFEGQTYCLHTGWTNRTQAEVQAAARSAVHRQRRTGAGETTGDKDAAALLREIAGMTPRQRARAEREELTRAAAQVTKVWQLRHELQGVPLPPSRRRSGASARTSTAPLTGSKVGDYPRRSKVIKRKRALEQQQSWWCGPATAQMITWAWNGFDRGQKYWAAALNTTSSGTAITDMVRVVNDFTGYDKRKRAGTYIVLDISDFTYQQWLLLQMRHIEDYRAPVVLHPVLHKKFFPYLDDDASGHFQVGRGYDKWGPKPTKISYFEPWNQQRFDPSEPFIKRVQWRSAYASYRANRAHFQHNLGV